MAHREFIDADGVQWQAWEVIPLAGERRDASERRFGTRDQRDRRVRQQLRVKMHEDLAQGWLVLECATEKRRIHPIPARWLDLTDGELAELARAAELAPRATPRLIE